MRNRLVGNLFVQHHETLVETKTHINNMFLHLLKDFDARAIRNKLSDKCSLDI